jgi:signal transduction histidine kinase
LIFDLVINGLYDPLVLQSLRNFFDLNSALVFFVYGQVFFILGLAIALQSRRHSRLQFATTLGWLAAFGFIHAFHEWGLFFIPIQASYLGLPVLTFLQVLLIVLLAGSFVCLLAFGTELLRDRYTFLGPLPLIIGAIYAVFAIIMLISGDLNMGEWVVRSNITARYFIGFPAALIAAYGLRHTAETQIKPLGLDNIYRMMLIAGIALVAYAILAGLVVPVGNFFPAKVVNDSLLPRLFGIPIPVFRSIIGLVIMVAIIRALEVFDDEVEQLIESMEIDQSLVAERDRIGRELHDGAIQQVYAAGLIVESARHKVEPEAPIGQQLDRAVQVLNQAIASLRSYMSDLRADPEQVSLTEGLRKQAADLRLNPLLDIELLIDLPDPANMEPIRTNHILAIVQEALANIARHAQTRQATLNAKKEHDRLILKVSDNGRGFDPGYIIGGYGLRNMRDRARLLGGQLEIQSDPGRGTVVTLVAPWDSS